MNHAIIVGAGQSARMKSKQNKIFLPLLDKPMIYYTIKVFEYCDLIDDIIIVAQKNDIEKIKSIIKKYNFKKVIKLIEGGKERQDSVYNGFKAIYNAKSDDIVVVHNASNPLVKEEEIINCINDAKQYDSAVCAFPVKDTIKKIQNNFAEKTVNRENLWQMQTPQAIKYGIFVEAFENAINKKINATDDVALVEHLGKKVKITNCSYENIKITTQDDLRIAEGILTRRNKTLESNNNKTKKFFDFRVGLGQDSHAFSTDKNKKLILGGFVVPNEIGLKADSDGDIILHALFNAVSQTVGDKSLGFYADELCKKGIKDSKEYLKIILEKLNKKDVMINNIGIMIEAKKPKLEQYNDAIKESLSTLLKLEKEKIGISLTSGECLTSFGRGEGMQCFAVVSSVKFQY